jgi:hypothetical protein
MLTNLDFLKPGEKWPPESEIERLTLYQENKAIFEGRHMEIYREQFKRIERVIGNFDNVISYGAILPYEKKMTLKCADLLFGEPPTISAGEEGSPEQISIDTIIENSDLNNTAYMGIIDASMTGSGIFQIYQEENGGRIDILPPGYWFPVVDPANIKKFLYHVIAWKIKDGETDYLKVHIHEKGRYEERLYLIEKNFNSSTIGKLLENNIVETELSDFAIIPFQNVVTSDSIFGYDDYSEIKTIVLEICIRISQIAKILDLHASPSVQGPPAMAVKDAASGEWTFKMGQYFEILDKDQAEVKYITWDGQLSAAFQQLEVLTNSLYTISEMGSAIFGDLSNKTGQVPSGSALKRLMISPLAKVNRLRMRLDPALKKAIKLCSELPGNNIVKLDSVSITWQDGLPGDSKEEAEIMQMRTAGNKTMSVKRALRTYDNLSDEEADNEISMIEEDEAKNNPLAVPPFGGFTRNEENAANS